MDPLDKQIERIRPHIREGVPRDVLRTGLQALNAMKSAMQQGGEDAVKRWAAKSLTQEMRNALIKIAEADDKCDSPSGVGLAGAARMMFTLMPSA